MFNSNTGRGICAAVLLAGAALTLHATTALAASPEIVMGVPGPYAVKVQTTAKYAVPSQDSVIQCSPVAQNGHFAGPYPAMMLIHGGAWSSGSNAIGPSYTGSSSTWCTLWASWGFQAFSVGYRLTGDAPWPAQIVDVQAAIRWVRTNAGKLGVNTGMIGVDGDSAGGQLAMIAGYSDGDIAGDLSNNNANHSSHPQLVISQFGPWTFGPSRPAGAPSVEAKDYASGLLMDMADKRTKTTPPFTLFLQGTQDTTVPACSQSIAGYNFLTSNNQPASYLAYAGKHEFSDMPASNWKGAVGSLQDQTIKFGYLIAHQDGVLPTSEVGPTLTTVAGNPLPTC